MDFKITNSGSAIKVQISKDITFDDYNSFRAVIDKIKNNGDGECVVDMKNVDYIDSAGLGMLLLLHEEAASRNIAVTIYSGNGQVARMMELAKFDTMFKIVPDNIH